MYEQLVLYCDLLVIIKFSFSLIAERMAKMVLNSTQIPSSSLRGGAMNNEKTSRIISGKGKGEGWVYQNVPVICHTCAKATFLPFSDKTKQLCRTSF